MFNVGLPAIAELEVLDVFLVWIYWGKFHQNPVPFTEGKICLSINVISNGGYFVPMAWG